MCIYGKIGQVMERSTFAGSPHVTNGVRWVGNANVETLVTVIPSKPAHYVSLSLEVVGTVSHRDFNMQAHGNWTPTCSHRYCDHAGSFTLEGHGSQVIALTWNSVLTNIKQIQGNALGGILANDRTMLFTHRLFRPCTPQHRVLPTDPFHLRNWPSNSDEQVASVLTMDQEGTWTPQALPLYDSQANLVLPHMYPAILPGSLVAVKFTVTRHHDPESGSHNHRANVEEVNVLETTKVEIASEAHAKLVDSMRKYRPLPV